MKTLRGVIHGKTIELVDDANLPEGQEVTVMVEPVVRPGTSPLEALKRAAGSWTDDLEGLDRYLEWNRQQRKVHRRELSE
ncbi:MAG: hypothetical protein L0Z62_06700 [Gemmataceae bacterium]|nr:hypothetical protein [Gemmataceae bacterium]